MLPLVFQHRLRFVGFIGTDVVVLEGGQDRFHARLDFRWLVTGTVARQQKFQHKGRHVGAFFDPVQQILPDHFAVKDREEFLI